MRVLFLLALSSIASAGEICEETLVQLEKLVTIHETANSPALSEALEQELIRIHGEMGAVDIASNPSPQPVENETTLVEVESEVDIPEIRERAIRLIREMDSLESIFGTKYWNIVDLTEAVREIYFNPKAYGFTKEEVERIDFERPDQNTKVMIPATLVVEQTKNEPARALKALEFLLERNPNLVKTASPYTNPVFSAFIARSLDAVKLCFKFGVPKDLMVAPHGGLVYYATSSTIEILQYLLDQGVPFDVRGENGYTPLGYAVASARWKVALFLLKAGADWRILQYKNSDFNVYDMLFDKALAHGGDAYYRDLRKAIEADIRANGSLSEREKYFGYH